MSPVAPQRLRLLIDKIKLMVLECDTVKRMTVEIYCFFNKSDRLILLFDTMGDFPVELVLWMICY